MSATGNASTLPPDRQTPGKVDDPTDGDSLGEYLTIDDGSDPDVPLIEEAEGGGLLVTLGTPYESKQSADGFYANLAEVLPDAVMDRLASDLLRKFDEDKKGREDRIKQYEEGLRRTGLGDDAPGGASFEGASKVVHPSLTEACIDYEARLIKELWPPSGPVRENIVGVPTKEKVERAKRKTEYMNWQLTEQIQEAHSVMEQMLSQVPLGGAQFVKLWFDHKLKKPRMQFVPIDKVLLPANAASWHTASRRTFEDTISDVDLKARVKSGMYRDVILPSASAPPDKGKAQTANDKIEGVDSDIQNLDGDRNLYESMTLVEVTEDMTDVLEHETPGDMYPYLITIDQQSRKVLAVYRDWEQDDETRQPIDHLFEFGFIPWRGAYPIGLPQIIGGLSGATTGALRALLDSAHIANVQGGLLLKGSGVGGQSTQVNPGEYREIDSTMGTDDIRKVALPFASHEPSQTLFQLLGFLVEASKSVVRTSLDDIAEDMNSNVPVGTQQSRVEQGLVVFSAIHGRIHTAFNRLLVGLARLNRMYLPDFVRVDAAGKEIIVRRKDYEGPPDVQPTSDPTIFSEQQRMAQIQAIMQRSAMVPGLYQPREVEKRFLKLMKVPDPDSLLVPAPEPHELNAVNENLAMAMARPVTVFPDQEHLAHLQVHLDFLASPVFGGNPIIGPKFTPALIQHCAEHMLYFYVKTVDDLVTQAAGRPSVDLMSTDDDVKADFDKLLALASQRVMPELPGTFEKATDILATAMQHIQSMMPKPPVDPAAAAQEAAAAETARKTQADQMGDQTDVAKLSADAANNAEKNRLQAQRNAIDMQRNQIAQDKAAMDNVTRLRQTILDTDTARDVAEMKVETGAGGRYSDGASLR